MSNPSDWVAQLDQARQGMSDLAKMIAEYQAALIANGMTREDALVATVAFQQAILTQTGTDEDG